MTPAIPEAIQDLPAPAPTKAPVLSLDTWLSAIDQRTARLAIVGLGYVGLPLTLLFSEERFAVTGFDVDHEKIALLNSGRSYIHRIEPEHIHAARRSGFDATADFSRIAQVDAVIICVPTPLHEDHTPDMSFVVSTIESIAPHLRSGQLVVLESTTYPGTTQEIIVETINRLGRNRGLKVLQALPYNYDSDLNSEAQPLDGVMVAFSPEREDPGNMITPRREVPKVIGAVESRAAAAAAALYGAVFHKTVLMSSPAAAEMTKLLENIYRSVNIALVNELKQLCEHMSIDIWEVIEAAATKPFGFQPFYPGPGVGGHCIPVDPFYLSWRAKKFGFSTRFIELAGEVNESMPAYVVDTSIRALARNGIDIMKARILVLGVAYKRDVDDLRESPSLTIIELLRKQGAAVAYNDPFFPSIGHGRKYALNVQSTPVSDDAHEVAAFDCVVIATDHSVYDIAAIVDHARLVIDTRNAARDITSHKIVRC